MKYILILFLLSFSAFAEVTFNPEVKTEFNLIWDLPTQFLDDTPIDSSIPAKTIIEQSIDGGAWTPLTVEITAPDNTTVIQTAPLGEAVLSYRVKYFITGYLISEPSNIMVVNLVIPKQPKPPILHEAQ